MMKMRRVREFIFVVAAVAAVMAGALFGTIVLSSGNTAYAADTTVTASGTCGDNLTWELTSDGTLTISGTGEMENYNWSSDTEHAPWRDYSVETIIINEGVESIGDCAFMRNEKLKTVSIPDTVKKIEEWAFAYATKLVQINLPQGVVLEDGAFLGCASLTDVTIPKEVTSIGYAAFSNCTSLVSVTIPDSVTIIDGYAFSGCIGLTDITIPNEVTKIGNHAFYQCTSLTNIDIPYGVTELESYVFSDCSSLMDIKIPESITNIGNYAFSGCSGLTDINIPDSVTSLGEGAFSDCINMDRISIPDGVQTIGYGAFCGCSSLQSIDFPDNLDCGGSIDFDLTNGILTINGVEMGISGYSGYSRPWVGLPFITKAVIESGVKDVGSRAFYGCSELKEVVIPDSATVIGYSAFNGCSSLTDLTIPDSVTKIYNNAFTGSGLTSITIPDSVTYIGEDAFSESNIQTIYGFSSSCAELYARENGLKFIDVNTEGESDYQLRPATPTVSVENEYSYIKITWSSVNNADYYEVYRIVNGGTRTLVESTNDSSVNSYADTKVVTNVNYTYIIRAVNKSTGKYTDSATSISVNLLKGYSGKAGENIAWDLDIDTGLLTVSGTGTMSGEISQVIPNHENDIKKVSIDSGITSICKGAFSDCRNLTEVDIPDTVVSIGDNAFSFCSALTEVTIPNSVTSIGNQAFEYCKLRSITIPDSVTSIGDEAFRFGDLVSIELPSSIIRVGDGLFYYCEKLTTVTVPDNIANLIYGAQDTFSRCCSLEEMIIPSGVLEIGDEAFYECEGLKTLTIPDSVTNIGAEAFYGCTGLTKVAISENVTNIGESAFGGCTGIKEINITSDSINIGKNSFKECTDLTTLTVLGNSTRIGAYAFSSCDSLTNITLPNGAVYIGEGAFAECSSLKDMTLTTGVTSVGNYAFYDCGNLENMTIEDGVTNIGSYVFYNCKTLTSVNLPESVTSMGVGLFRGCIALMNITIPDSVSKMGASMFYDCVGLTSVMIPTNVTSIGSNVFYNCTNLTTIYGTSGSYAETYASENGYTFVDTSSSTDPEITITAPTIKTEVVDSAVKITWDSVDNADSYTVYRTASGGTKTELTTISSGSDLSYTDSSIEKDISYVYSVRATNTSTGKYADSADSDTVKVASESSTVYSGTAGDNVIWTLEDGVLTISGTGEMEDFSYDSGTVATWRDCGVTSVIIQDGVTSIGEYAFRDCSDLASITISKSVTSIGGFALYKCSGLTSVTIPEGVTSIGIEAFECCSSLASVNIPKSLTMIGNSAFRHCSSLTSINIPESVTSIGDCVFAYCSSLASIIVQNGNSYYRCDGNYLIEIEANKLIAVAVSGLTSATIPDDVTSIGWGAFEGCSSLKSIEIAESVTSIGWYAFNGCGSLISINIPEGVTSIGNGTFWSCINLTGITIPSSVTSIDSSAFENCTSLTTIYGTTGSYAETYAGENGYTFVDTSGSTDPEITVAAPSIKAEVVDDAVQVTWNSVDNADTYTVYRAKGSGAWMSKVTISAGSDMSYTDTTVETGVSYKYFVRAKNTATGKYADSSSSSSVTVIAHTGTIGSNLTWTLDGDGTLTISGTGEMADGQISTGTDTEVKKIIIESGITSVGDNAFEGYTGITDVTIADSVETVGDSAFKDCTGITTVTIPDTVTSVGDDAFAGCDNLTEVTVEGSETTIGTGAFASDVTINAESGSAAEKYASDNGCKFTDSNTGSEVDYTVKLTAPVLTVSVSSTNITISWTAVDAAEGYIVYRKTTDGTETKLQTVSSDMLSYSDTTAAENVSYTYRVEAYKGLMSETSEYSDSYKIDSEPTTPTTPSKPTTPTTTVVPTAPTVVAKVKSAGKVLLSWKASNDCDGYVIYRKAGSGNWKQMSAVPNNVATYTDELIKAGTKYSYMIKAYSGDTYSSGKASATVMWLSVPTLKATSTASGVKLRWSKSTGASGYVIYRKLSGGKWKKYKTVKSGTTSLTDSKGSASKAYSYKVRAYSGSVYSSDSSSSVAKPFYLKTPVATATVNSSGIKVKWSKVSGAKSYKVYRRMKGGKWTRLTVKVKKVGDYIHFVDTKVKSGKRYSYKVQAVSGSTTSKMKAGSYVMYLKGPKVKVAKLSSGIKIKWNKIPGAKGYVVYRLVGNGTLKRIKTTKGVSAVTYLDRTAKKGKKYTYAVRAMNGRNYSAMMTSATIKK